MAERLASRVLLIGWDAADWKIIQPLLDAGQMPHLERLIDGGAMGNIATLRPAVSPVLWTSIATGKHGDQHGIHGFVEPRLDGMGVQPVQSTSVRVRPIWRILRDRQLRTAVVGWYATHPAAHAGASIAVSNLFQVATGASFDEWPLPPDSIAPEPLRDTLRELRVHPADLEGEQLRYFIPKAAEIDQERDARLSALTKLIAECATIHAAGTHIAEHEQWDFLAVYYETIDRVCHEFIPYRAPCMADVSDEDAALYGEVVDNCYRFHDLMLGRYLQLVGPETTIVLVSDHGFFSDHLRPVVSSQVLKGAPLQWHRPHGIFVARGPGIRTDDLVFGASLLDVAPTILTMLGAPVGRDMEGRVLAQILERRMPVEYVDTHEPLAALPDNGLDADADVWAAQEAVKQLVALGYVDAPSDDASQAIEAARDTQTIILADVYISKCNFAAAVPLLEELISRQPQYARVKLRLALCRLRLGDMSGCRALVDEVFGGLADSPVAQLAYGTISAALGEWDDALARFDRAQTAMPDNAQLHGRRGTVLLRQQRWDDAEAAFRRATQIDEHLPSAYDGLGMALYGQRRFDEAIESFLRSIGLLYYQPYVHVRLGVAFAGAGRVELARDALHRAIDLQPDLPAAHAFLDRLNQPPVQSSAR